LNPLTELSASELRALASAIADNRLPGFHPAALSRYVAEPEKVSKALTTIDASEVATAQVLELLAQAVDNRRSVEDAVQLVVTGPDEAANRMTSVVIRQLFRDAIQSVWVCGYRPFDAREIFRDLARPGLQVQMLLDIGRGKGTEKEIVTEFLQTFKERHWPEHRPLPEIWYDPQALLLDANERAVAHAKCVVADRRWLFVSSANFTDAALSRNLEAGVLIDSQKLARQMETYLDGLIRKGRILRAQTTYSL
jgi:phosphatidylserine/phosphatidylglycerophosphate/cardiolipin synthase-like enzyme